MALMHMEFNNLNDVLINQLQDLYDAEQRLTDALPKMAEAAHASELKQAFEQHKRQTETHVQRLERCFRDLNCEPQKVTCYAMKGLIDEGSEIIKARGDGASCDAALIAASQKVEHYEIASYGSVRNFAEHLGRSNVAQTLQMTLDEEGQTDKLLTQLAESNINQTAAIH